MRRVVGPATNLSKRAAPVERSFAQSKRPEARKKKGKKSDKTEKRPKEEKATKQKKKTCAVVGPGTKASTAQSKI